MRTKRGQRGLKEDQKLPNLERFERESRGKQKKNIFKSRRPEV